MVPNARSSTSDQHQDKDREIERLKKDVRRLKMKIVDAEREHEEQLTWRLSGYAGALLDLLGLTPENIPPAIRREAKRLVGRTDLSDDEEEEEKEEEHGRTDDGRGRGRRRGGETSSRANRTTSTARTREEAPPLMPGADVGDPRVLLAATLRVQLAALARAESDQSQLRTSLANAQRDVSQMQDALAVMAVENEAVDRLRDDLSSARRATQLAEAETRRMREEVVQAKLKVDLNQAELMRARADAEKWRGSVAQSGREVIQVRAALDEALRKAHRWETGTWVETGKARRALLTWWESYKSQKKKPAEEMAKRVALAEALGVTEVEDRRLLGLPRSKTKEKGGGEKGEKGDMESEVGVEEEEMEMEEELRGPGMTDQWLAFLLTEEA